MTSRLLLATGAVLVAGLLLIATAFAAIFVVAPTVLADRYSHYDYEFTVETNATLSDVTFYLPVPTSPNGTPVVGDVVVRGDDGASVANDSSVVTTEHGPMLSIDVDRMEGRLEYLLLAFDDEGNLTTREVISPDEVPADLTNKQLRPISTEYSIHVFYEYRDGGEAIDTRTPMDSEPTLSPKFGVTETDCEYGFPEETDACYDYGSRLFASYDTTEDNVVHVSGEYAGWNEWGWGLSNSYNSFTERVERTALAGPQDGWTVVDGSLHAGEGNYPTRGN